MKMEKPLDRFKNADPVAAMAHTLKVEAERDALKAALESILDRLSAWRDDAALKAYHATPENEGRLRNRADNYAALCDIAERALAGQESKIAEETDRNLADLLARPVPEAKPKGFTVCGYYVDDNYPACFHVECDRLEDVLDKLEQDRLDDFDGEDDDDPTPPEVVITGIFEGMHDEISAALDAFQKCVTTPREA